jgi:hypothetical protein
MFKLRFWTPKRVDRRIVVEDFGADITSAAESVEQSVVKTAAMARMSFMMKVSNGVATGE